MNWHSLLHLERIFINICEAQYAHWVVDGGIEEEWDSYLKQLKDMGVEELVKIQETAYEAYQENMK